MGHPAHAAGLAGQKKKGYMNPVIAIPNNPRTATRKKKDWLEIRNTDMDIFFRAPAMYINP
jgi:hypothetical protein